MDATTENTLVLDVDTQGSLPSLSVELVTGQIEIVGWDRPQIVLTSDDADEDVDLEDLFAVRKNGNQIAVNVSHGGGGRRKKHQPRDEWDIDAMIRQTASAMRGISAELQVKVPFTCDVEVRTASGDISIEAVDGKISANSASGGIRLADVQGSVLAKSVSGEVTVSEFNGRLGVRTMSGDIDVSAGELEDLSIGTASGDIDITGRLAPDGDYEIQTVSGDVLLNVPGDTRCVAEIQTVSGDIRSELPGESQRSGRRRQKLLVNGGDGPTLRINTTSGDVRLEEWRGAPEPRRERRAVTQPLATAQVGANSQEQPEAGNTVRMDQPQTTPRESAEMAILQAIESGEMSVEEGVRRLNELSQSA